MKPQEHHSEAKRLAREAEFRQREPNQPFNPELWLKAQTHALLALCGEMEEIRAALAPRQGGDSAQTMWETKLPGDSA